MSIPPFATVPTEAILDRRISNAQMRVLTVMCAHANRRHLCWAKVDTMAEELGVTKQAISKSIRQLVTLGYVEVARYGFPAKNKYRLCFDQSERAPLSEIDDAPDVEDWTTCVSQLQSQPHVDTGAQSQPHVDTRVNLTLTHSQPHVDRRTEKENRENGNIVSHDDLLASSLAPQAPVSIPREKAPAAREGAFDASALKRDPLTLTLIACLGYEPATRREWGQWRIAVNDLRACGVTSDDIPRAIRGYQATYPRARVTPLALVGHWAEIQKGKPHDLAQLEINRRAATTDQQLQAERERADAERRAQEEREVKQLLAEYGYADGR